MLHTFWNGQLDCLRWGLGRAAITCQCHAWGEGKFRSYRDRTRIELRWNGGEILIKGWTLASKMSLLLQSANIIPLIITIVKTKKPKWLNYRKMVSSSNIYRTFQRIQFRISGYIMGHSLPDQRNCSNTKMKHFMFVLRFMVFYSSDVWLLVFCQFFGTFKLEETRSHFIFYSTWCPLSIVLLPVSIN